MKARSKVITLLTWRYSPNSILGPPSPGAPHTRTPDAPLPWPTSAVSSGTLRRGPAGSQAPAAAHRRAPPPRAASHPHLCPAAARCKQHDTESKRLKNNMGLLLRQDVLSLEAPGGSAPQGHRQRPSLSLSAPPASAPWPSSSSSLAPGVGKWLLQRQVLLPSAARLESGRTHTPRAPLSATKPFPKPQQTPLGPHWRDLDHVPPPTLMPERWDHWTCAHRGPVTKEEG